MKLCSVEGCTKQHSCKGVCKDHYMRAYWRADTTKRRKRSSALCRKYHTGFTDDDVAVLRQVQSGRCAICCVELDTQTRKRGEMQARIECADHFETLNGQRVRSGTKGATKHPRGLLCLTCNAVLGHYENHQRVVGMRIAAYEEYLAAPPFRTAVNVLDADSCFLFDLERDSL